MVVPVSSLRGYDIRIAQWNVRSASVCRRGELVKKLKMLRIDICTIQETREVEEFLELEDYRFLNFKSENVHQGGVGILVRNDLFNDIKNVIKITESKGRIIIVELSDLTVISAYAPHEGYDLVEKISFMKCLSQSIKLCRKKKAIFIGGDFNARLDITYKSDKTVGKYLYKDHCYDNANQSNRENGSLLYNLAVDNKLFFAKSFFRSKKNNNNRTFISPGKTAISNSGYKKFAFSQIDHILYSKRFRKDIKSCRHYGEFHFGRKKGIKLFSDHKLIVTVIKSERPLYKYCKKKNPKKEIYTWSVNNIEKFNKFCHNKIQKISCEDTDRFWSYISDDFNRCFKKYLELELCSGGNVDNMFENCTEESGVLNFDEFMAKKADEIEKQMKRNNIKNVWKLLKFDYKKKFFFKKNVDIKEVANSLRVNSVVSNYIWIDNEQIDNIDLFMDRDLTRIELCRVVHKLQYNKSCGLDNIPGDIFKIKLFNELLFDLLSIIWKEKRIPEVWRTSKLVPIPKKENGKFRGINVLSVGYKIFASIIYNRIYNKIANFVGYEQSGFIKGRSTNDVIFAVRKIFENVRYDGGSMHAMLIDFAKAFPSINRLALRHILLNKVMLSRNMVDRVMDLLENSKEVLSIGKDSLTFDVSAGVRQGCPLGPILFSVVIAELVKEVQVDFPNIVTFLYADDLTFMSDSETILQDVLLKVKEKGIKYGLLVNNDKTEYISVVNRKFTKESKLLGAWIGNNDVSVNNNIKKAKSSFYAFYHSIWKQQNIEISTKMKIFNSFVTSILLYSLDSLALSNNQIAKLNSFAFQCYKSMLGLYYDKINNINISKEKVFNLIKEKYENFQEVSEILRLRRLNTWFHFTRNHAKDPRDFMKFTLTKNPVFRKTSLLLASITRDLKDLPSYIPKVL